jgi:hypothetical protein
MTEKDTPAGADEPTPEHSEPEAATPAAAESAAAETAEPAEPDEPRRGQVRFQDAETARPREPTLAERRARERALEQEEERVLAAAAEAERKTRLRRRIMIGGGVTVGVVALVAVWYAAVTPDEVTAHCVAANDSTLAQDENVCDENYVRSHGGYHSGGIFFLPLPGGGYSQYRYNYGGTVSGGRVLGGSTAAPSGRTTVKTSSGKTVQRGGLGVSGSGKSGGS